MNYFKTIALAVFVYSTTHTMQQNLDLEKNTILPIHEIKKKFSKEDNGTCEYLIGLKLYRGIKIPQNSAAAFTQFLKAAEKGNQKSLYIVAYLYNAGEGTEKNFPKYLEYIEKAAKAGDPWGQYFYGSNLVAGLSGKKNFSEGLEWIKKSADQGVGDALATLGLLSAEGIDHSGAQIEPDYEKSFELYKKASEKNSYQGKYFLAISYSTGLSGEKNTVKATKLYNEILEANEPQALPFKALMFETGRGIEKNLEKAKQFYELCIQQNPQGPFGLLGLERVKQKINDISKREQELLKELEKETKQQSKKHHKKTENKPVAQLSHTNIDFSDSTLKDILNTVVSYDDQSIITGIDTIHHTIAIKKPSDDSMVTILIDQPKSIAHEDLKNLTQFTYEDRVSKWFGSEDTLQINYNLESIKRHSFAQRVDEIAELYGDSAIFIKSDGTLQENKILYGSITTKDKHSLNGTFEYAYYQNIDGKKVLYHRFLHPHTKAVLIDEKSCH